MVKKKAKIASKKKGRPLTRSCPVCETEMKITKVMRYSEGPRGILWVCENESCLTIVSKHGVQKGSLLDEAAA